jgi:hypothetical protein
MTFYLLLPPFQRKYETKLGLFKETGRDEAL